MTTVNAHTEEALRAAFGRLLDGTPECTDVALTIANLAREARVSRASANRATAIAELLRAEVVRRTNSGQDTIGALRDRIRRLEIDLAERRATEQAEHRRLRQAVHASSQHVQAITLENDALRDDLARHGAIYPLAGPGTTGPVRRSH